MSDSEPDARTSNCALRKIELSNCSAYYKLRSLLGERLYLNWGWPDQVRVVIEIVYGLAGWRFRTNTSPRRSKPALLANVYSTESRMSLFSNLKLVTPATLLSGSSYWSVRYLTFVLMKPIGHP